MTYRVAKMQNGFRMDLLLTGFVESIYSHGPSQIFRTIFFLRHTPSLRGAVQDAFEIYLGWDYCPPKQSSCPTFATKSVLKDCLVRLNHSDKQAL
jgi:hypothetical protein